jgi:tRNA U55 pseudouridine synthase TruB
VKVLEAEVLGKEKIGIEEFLALQQEKVAQVRGDFRQEEILSDWREKFADIASKEDNELIVSKLRVVCSSGFYVRQFIQDVAKKIGVPALAFSIVRTRNGSFEREEC